MKKFNFKLSGEDINAIVCALEVMPSYGCYDVEDEANSIYALSASSGKKLIMREQLSTRETFYVALAIDNAFKAIRGEITLADDALDSLRPYLFTINKLHQVFSPLLDEIV